MPRLWPWALACVALLACGDNHRVDVASDALTITVECSEDVLGPVLASQPGITGVTKVACGPYVRPPAQCFKLALTQPIHHDAAPTSPTFAQQLFLVHRGCGRPMVVADWGYANEDFYDDELSTLFRANSLWVEHRYQGQSVPVPDAWDWSGLTIENGAADLHQVIVTMKAIYGGRWVSTGASKGGITATYHAFFFPDDLDGTIPYVAPASRSRIDPDYQQFIETHMTSPCAQQVRDAQVAALTTRRAAMLTRLSSSVPASLAERYLEYIADTADWGFWQRHGTADCAKVPTDTATDDAFFMFFQLVSGFPAHAPATDERSGGALEYEWLTEQGFALQVGPHVRDLLTDPIVKATMEERFGVLHPEVTLPAYDGSVTRSVRNWVETRAQNLLLIYGELDPWSGGALEEPQRVTSARYFVPGANHGAHIGGLEPADRTPALAHAERMFGIPPDLSMVRQAMEAGTRRDEIVSRAAAGTLRNALLRQAPRAAD